MIALRSFQPQEVLVAFGLAFIIESTLFVVLATATNDTKIHEKTAVEREPEPIQVKPVLDELPLLKLGSKKMKAKLPDMWVKKPPIVKRVEATSAPSPKAELNPEKLPDTPLPKASAEPPPPDAAIAKKVDEVPKTDASAPPANLPTEGAEDGVKEGTEKDPLKAFAVSQYRMKIAGWFRARFQKPKDIPCDVLKTLRASVSVNISGDRTVTGFAIGKPSGNATFDGNVKSSLDAIVSMGAELPPPPPNYPDILQSTLNVQYFVPSCD